MSRKLFVCDYCLTPLRTIQKAGILCEEKKIIAIGGESSFEIEPDLEVTEIRNAYAIPGMIDTHIHGAGGFDSSSAFDEKANFDKMCSILASHGICSFVPTITSGPPQTMLEAISSIVKFASAHDYSGAKPVGLHIEGPFLSREKHGAQYEEDIRPIDIGELKEIISAGNGFIKIMTFAPELLNSDHLINVLLENNIVPSLGHSMANADQALRAIDAGARRCAHVFNGMPPLHHRDISLTSVVLTDDRVDVEILIDGCHVHPRMVDLVCRAKPKEKIIAISDAVQATGLSDGEYHIGDTKIIVKDGYVTTETGTLAGTTFTLERGLGQLLAFSHLNRNEVAACLTLNPARSIGLKGRGELSPGSSADIAFFNIENNKSEMTVIDGEIVFRTSSK
jgi:N-acetylglucosamine-6-phosphate deacetylase